MKTLVLNKKIGASALLAVMSVGAFAQSAPPPLTGITTAASSQFGTFLTENAPALVALTLLVVGFKFVMKTIKKGIK